MHITDQLSYSTIRIECKTNAGYSSTGTGFFFNFCCENNTCRPAIVTNKHVIKDATECNLIFTLADSSGNPIDEKHWIANIIGLQSAWKLHPDPDIDLCVMPIANIINHLNANGIRPFYIGLDISLIPSEKQKAELQAIEDIIMVGYPDGIWDKINNKPIFRKGITATHPNKNYNGKKEFLIDAACFNGSSGSPIFIYNEIGYLTGNTFNLGQKRLLFMGVLRAGHLHSIKGDICIADQALKPVSLSYIPNNLGIVIKSENLLYFEEMFRKGLNH